MVKPTALRERIKALDIAVDTQCPCADRKEKPAESYGDASPEAPVWPDCGECGHPLTEHPNGWTCLAIVRRPKSPKVLREEVLALISEPGS